MERTTMRLQTTMLITALLIARGATAQQSEPDPREQTPPRAEGQNASAADPVDRDAIIERLERTIDFSQRIIEKNREALERLNNGEDPREVIRSLRAPDLQRTMREKRAERRPDRDPPAPSDTLSDRQIERVRAFIAEHLPEVNEQIGHIEALGPGVVRPVMSRLVPPIEEIMRLERTDPTLSRLKLAEFRAGLAYVEAVRLYRVSLRSGAPESERETRRARVESAAAARFDTLVRIKLHEIETLGARIEQLRASLDVLVEQRDEQIEAQVESASRTPGTRLSRPASDGNASNQD